MELEEMAEAATMVVVQAAVAAAVAVAAAATVAMALAMAALAAGTAAVVAAAAAATTNWIGGRHDELDHGGGFFALASWIRGVAGGIWACAIHGLGFDTG